MKIILCFCFFLCLSFKGFTQNNFHHEGEASYVSEDFQGSSTKSGQIFDNTQKVAAHPFLPMNTLVKVTNLENNRSVEVKIIDRCTCPNRVINISKAAASQIGLVSSGKAKVRIESIGTIPMEETAEVAKVLPMPAMIPTSFYPTKREFKSSDEDLLHVKSVGEPALTYIAATEPKYLPATTTDNSFNNAGVYSFAGQLSAPKGMGLQVGVFSSVQGMKTVCQELKNQGINAKELYIQVVAKDGGKLFKVLVGSYANQSPELLNKLKELTDKGYKALVKTYL